jgi:hypothetical protein
MNHLPDSSKNSVEKPSKRKQLWFPLSVLLFGLWAIAKAGFYRGPLTDILDSGTRHASPTSGWLLIAAGAVMIAGATYALFSKRE